MSKIFLRQNIFERFLVGEELHISYDADMNNIDMFARYGFTLDDQPLNPSMYLSYLDIKIACTVLNNEDECSELLETTWPFYNATRSDDDQLKMRIRQG